MPYEDGEAFRRVDFWILEGEPVHRLPSDARERRERRHEVGRPRAQGDDRASGDEVAPIEVTQSMNSRGDRLSSVLIWHALADDGSEGEDYYEYDEAEGYDYTGHVPSAMALGFSYYEVDNVTSSWPRARRGSLTRRGCTTPDGCSWSLAILARRWRT